MELTTSSLRKQTIKQIAFVRIAAETPRRLYFQTTRYFSSLSLATNVIHNYSVGTRTTYLHSLICHCDNSCTIGGNFVKRSWIKRTVGTNHHTCASSAVAILWCIPTKFLLSCLGLNSFDVSSRYLGSVQYDVWKHWRSSWKTVPYPCPKTY